MATLAKSAICASCRKAVRCVDVANAAVWKPFALGRLSLTALGKQYKIHLHGLPLRLQPLRFWNWQVMWMRSVPSIFLMQLRVGMFWRCKWWMKRLAIWE